MITSKSQILLLFRDLGAVGLSALMVLTPLPIFSQETSDPPESPQSRSDGRNIESTGYPNPYETQSGDRPSGDVPPLPPPPDITAPTAGTKLPIPEADIASGALTYQIPIAAPPGRRNLQPDLSLDYNSLNNSMTSPVGLGWELTLPFIERKNVNGVNTLYDRRDFYSTFDGELSEQSHGEFIARVDLGSALKYEFLEVGPQKSWKVIDKTGIQYIFGDTSEGRLSDPDDESKTFRWYLTKKIDRNSNSIVFNYKKFDYQVYLDEVMYTNHDSLPGIFRIKCLYQDRPDTVFSAVQGFQIQTTKRLWRIEAYQSDSKTNETVLTYSQHPANNRTLLRTVQHFGFDIDGQPSSYGPWLFSYEAGNAAALLSEIELPTGGRIAASYLPSAQVIDPKTLNRGNPNLPFSFSIVREIQFQQKDNGTWKNEFRYTGGAFYFGNPLDKRVAGFERVAKIDSTGNSVTTYFHQGNGDNTDFDEVADAYEKLGRPYKVETRSSSGVLFSQEFNKWDSTTIGTHASRTLRISTLKRDFDGDSVSRDSAVKFEYDGFGNLAREMQFGEVSANDDGTFVDLGSDAIETVNEHATPVNASSYMVGLLSRTRVFENSSVLRSETLVNYDQLSFNLVDKGNPTKERRWIEGAKYSETNRVFNSFGLIEIDTDPNGNNTLTTYDSAFLYPHLITNARGHQIQAQYDYTSGSVTNLVDPNGRIFETKYDGLDRVVEERQPDPLVGTNLVSKSLYVYTDVSNSFSIKRMDLLDDELAVESYIYLDGFGRAVQSRKESETFGQFVVRDLAYNSRGLLERSSLPYSSFGAGRTTPITDDGLFSRFEYDPIGRMISVSDNVGRISTQYNDWKKVITDRLGNTRVLINDAYGRLSSVEERLASESLLTSYEYDALNNLTNIIDAQGNVRRSIYDGLGRRKMSEDLHAADDKSFGHWQFVFDDVGNVIQRTDPNGDVVVYEYDELSRIKTEDFLGQKGIEIEYVYDNCSDGIGRSCRDRFGSVVRNREYNPLGLVKFENTAIGGNQFESTFTYDRAGNLREYSNPDGSIVQYRFNQGGGMEAVWTKEPGQPGFTPIVADLDYAPNDQISTIDFGNGIRSEFLYDQHELYRLKRKITSVVSGMQKIQDFAYTYDPSGNLLQIDDRSELNSQKILTYRYDDLYRLTYANASKTTGLRMFRQIFDYDAIGNFEFKSDQGAYEYDGNQGTNFANPHAVTSIGNTQIAYDKNGNILSVGNQRSFVWNYNNWLAQVSHGTEQSLYEYNAGGDRVRTVTAGDLTFDPTKFYSTSTSRGIEKHIFIGNLMIATIKGSGQGAQTYLNHTDHLGGTNVVTGVGGQIAERIEYFPFGGIQLDTVAQHERRKFSGHQYDLETGLSYMGARYYDGTFGRFLNVDPVFLSLQMDLTNPQNLNSYSYSRNNPVRFIDPDGNSFLDAVSYHLSVNALKAGVDKGINYGLRQVANTNGFGNPDGVISAGILKSPLAMPAIRIGADAIVETTKNWNNNEMDWTEKAARTTFSVADSAIVGLITIETGGTAGFFAGTASDISSEARFQALKQSSLVEGLGDTGLFKWLARDENWEADFKKNQELQEQARRREMSQSTNINNGPKISVAPAQTNTRVTVTNQPTSPNYRLNVTNQPISPNTRISVRR